MLFYQKKKRPSKTANPTAFDAAFKRRLGQDPVSYLSSKLSGGSDLGSVRHLFDILSAEIELKYKCNSPGFDFYYKKITTLPEENTPAVAEQAYHISKDFAISQLIGKARFLSQYEPSLKALSENQVFLTFLRPLKQQLAGQELTNTAAANRQIADYFYKRGANETFPEVRTIVNGVLGYGKQASAHISIYYAMAWYESDV